MNFNLQDQQLGETSGVHVIEGPETIQAVSLCLAQQCSRELLIRAQTLNHLIYDRQTFAEAVKQLAIRNARTRIRVLVTDIEPIKKNGHRMLQLAQRLSSSIEIRLGAVDWVNDSRSFLLADERGYVLRPRYFDLHDCVADFNSPYEARKLREFFNEVWDQSEVDVDLRRVSL